MSEQELGQLIRRARSAAGLTQGKLAEQVGLNQSAISMMEQGKPQSISDRKLLKLGEVLGLDLMPMLGRPDAMREVFKVCRSPGCMANIPVENDGKMILMPVMVRGVFGETTRCRYCAVPMEESCDCKALLREGVFCMDCGKPYVPAPEVEDVAKEVVRRQGGVRTYFELRHLLEADHQRSAQWSHLQKNLPLEQADQRGVRTDETRTGTTGTTD